MGRFFSLDLLLKLLVVVVSVVGIRLDHWCTNIIKQHTYQIPHEQEYIKSTRGLIKLAKYSTASYNIKDVLSIPLKNESQVSFFVNVAPLP